MDDDNFLYKDMKSLRKHGHIKPVPDFVSANLNPSFELRPYQREALENFITHFESSTCPKPTQVLFHMATGSGKTLIMAGLILYLYRRGYRNFLFFVNLTNILDKTRDNFLNAASAKYLFDEPLTLEGERVRVNVTENFQHVDGDAINLCFTTTQALHISMTFAKEGGMTFDDFDGRKVVLISDEAHHLNVDTGKKLSATDEDHRTTWENTIKHIFRRNADNVLLEFTATCDLDNPSIKSKYESLIVYDYPLQKFYDDRWSKEILTLRTATLADRVFNALVLSQYRLKLFQDRRLNIKPVVLFKSRTIDASKQFMKQFAAEIKNLRGSHLQTLSVSSSGIIQRAFKYFSERGITFENLAAELRDDFSEAHCISATSDDDADKNQLLLNSLEDAGNPYRAVFEVKMLDEGWDVLNLFDIVRLYETRTKSNTLSEAQLIGRGARYCPFRLDGEQPKYQRKFDGDITNDLRTCETLYYHCQDDSGYIVELHNALREKGLDLGNIVSREYKLKDSFKRDELYRQGWIFLNGREEVSRDLAPIISNAAYNFRTAAQIHADKVMADDLTVVNTAGSHVTCKTIKDIANKNYAAVNKALMKFPIYKFSRLKELFPALKSTRQFITDEKFLGGVRITITSNELEPSLETLHAAVFDALKKISETLNDIKPTYRGTTEFAAQKISDVFRDKTVNYSKEHADGLGMSQNDPTVGESRIDLAAEDWFAYNDNFGTSEEKAFVAYFRSRVVALKKIYRKIWLVRNERAVHVYSFDDGARFEPDYVLFLQRDIDGGFEQFQIFVEPKGKHLEAVDGWKEKFLLQLKARALPAKIFVDSNEYRIWGLPFYNRDKESDFDKAFSDLLK